MLVGSGPEKMSAVATNAIAMFDSASTSCI